MLPSAPLPRFTPADAGARRPSLNILFAYENLSAAAWASEVCRRWLSGAPAGTEPNIQPWSFAHLADPRSQAKAAEAADRADLIVIAGASSVKFLPPAVESWLRRCLGARGPAKKAVAAFFHGPHRHPESPESPRLRIVQRMAEEAGWEFVAPAAIHLP